MGGVCLKLATLDLDEQDAPKARLPAIDINILFDYEKAEVKSSEEAKLTQCLTDAKGTQAYNCHPSTQRAHAVSSHLAKQGIKPDRLVTIGAGEYVLRDKHNSEAAQNRRVGFAQLADGRGEIATRLAKLCNDG